jgi:hypothetical protein
MKTSNLKTLGESKFKVIRTKKRRSRMIETKKDEDQ